MVAETMVAETRVVGTGAARKATRLCARVGCDVAFAPKRSNCRFCSPQCAHLVYAGKAAAIVGPAYQPAPAHVPVPLGEQTRRPVATGEPILSAEIQERIKARAREIVEQTVREMVQQLVGDLVREMTRTAVRQAVREIAVALSE